MGGIHMSTCSKEIANKEHLNFVYSNFFSEIDCMKLFAPWSKINEKNYEQVA